MFFSTIAAPQRVTLIISAYNNHEALQYALWALERQTRVPDEILIADDGSCKAFQEFLAAYMAQSPLPIRHLWQEDRGFRKAKIMNQALQQATGDYIIMMDADVITPKEFVAMHLALARPGRFLSGGSQIQVPIWLQHKLSREDIETERLFTRAWYRERRVPHSRLWRLRVPPGLCAWLMDQLTPRPNAMIGCNASCWRHDALRIGGFNEAFEHYGYEDRDFARRLVKAGVRGVRHQFSLRYLHMEHARPYVDDAKIAANKTMVFGMPQVSTPTELQEVAPT
jgi:glycosyltransferase involved in cell wall biosynthesis